MKIITTAESNPDMELVAQQTIGSSSEVLAGTNIMPMTKMPVTFELTYSKLMNLFSFFLFLMAALVLGKGDLKTLEM